MPNKCVANDVIKETFFFSQRVEMRRSQLLHETFNEVWLEDMQESFEDNKFKKNLFSVLSHTRISNSEKNIFLCDKLFRVKNMMFGFCRMSYDIFIIKQSKLLYHHWKPIQMMANWINLNHKLLRDITQDRIEYLELIDRIKIFTHFTHCLRSLSWTFFAQISETFSIQIDAEQLQCNNTEQKRDESNWKFSTRMTSNPFPLSSFWLILGWMNNNGNEQIWYHNMLCRLNHFFTQQELSRDDGNGPICWLIIVSHLF